MARLYRSNTAGDFTHLGMVLVSTSTTIQTGSLDALDSRRPSRVGLCEDMCSHKVHEQTIMLPRCGVQSQTSSNGLCKEMGLAAMCCMVTNLECILSRHFFNKCSHGDHYIVATTTMMKTTMTTTKSFVRPKSDPTTTMTTDRRKHMLITGKCVTRTRDGQVSLRDPVCNNSKESPKKNPAKTNIFPKS